VKRLAKYLCITAAALLLVLPAGGWAVSRWVQSAAGRAAIEDRLGKALRMPVRIKTLTFSVWSGLTAGGVSVPGPFGDAFQAASISVGHRLASLLMGSLAFGEVRIEQPRLRVIEEAPRQSPLPVIPPAPPAAAGTATVPLATTPATPPAQEKKPRFTVGRIILNGGGAELLDRQHAPVATLTGLAVTLNDVTEHSFTGSFEGRVKAPKFSGTLSGEAQLAGLGSNAGAITGSGTLILKDGTCREIELMRQIGDLLQLHSVSSSEIAGATLAFQIADERIVVSPMTVSAPPLGLELIGASTFDGTLDLSAILQVPADVISQRGMIANQFSPPDQTNRRGVQFNITGPLKKPKHNLAECVTGTKDKRWQRIIAAEAIISSLTGKKTAPSPAPQPAPVQP